MSLALQWTQKVVLIGFAISYALSDLSTSLDGIAIPYLSPKNRTQSFIVPLGTCKVIALDVLGGAEQALVINISLAQHFRGYTGLRYAALMSPMYMGEKLHNEPKKMASCDMNYDEELCWETAANIDHEGFSAGSCEKFVSRYNINFEDFQNAAVRRHVIDGDWLGIWYMGSDYENQCVTHNGTYYIYLRTDSVCLIPEVCQDGVNLELAMYMHDGAGYYCWLANVPSIWAVIIYVMFGSVFIASFFLSLSVMRKLGCVHDAVVRPAAPPMVGGAVPHVGHP